MKSDKFRAGVGAVIINDEGSVLAFQRSDLPEVWQLPQGGLHKSEDLREGLYREVFEETGIPETNLNILQESPVWLGYEFPDDIRSEMKFRGQVHRWFLLRFTGETNNINLDAAPDDEFINYEWIPFESLMKRAIGFKQETYRLLSVIFSRYIRLV